MSESNSESGLGVRPFKPDTSVGNQRAVAERRDPKMVSPATAGPEDQIDPNADEWLKKLDKKYTNKGNK